MSDRKLYRALCGDFDAVSIIPGGGKAECIKLLGILNELLPTFSSRLRAIALLDRDVAVGDQQSNIRLLPVSMIENFLLDPLPLWEAIQSVVEKTSFSSIKDVDIALDAVLDEVRSNEIERRAKAALGLFYFRPETPIMEAPAQAITASRELIERYSTANVGNCVQEAERMVAGFEEIASGERIFTEKKHSTLFIAGIFKLRLFLRLSSNLKQRGMLGKEELFRDIFRSFSPRF